MYQVNKWLVVNILLDHNFLRFVLNAYLNFYSSQNKWKWKQVVRWWEQVSLPVLHWAVPYKFLWKSQNFWGVGVVKCKNLKARHKAKMNLSGLGVWIFLEQHKTVQPVQYLTKLNWSPWLPCCFVIIQTLPNIITKQHSNVFFTFSHSFQNTRTILSHWDIWHSNVITTRSIPLWYAFSTTYMYSGFSFCNKCFFAGGEFKPFAQPQPGGPLGFLLGLSFPYCRWLPAMANGWPSSQV